jgi:hypothetical protein
MHRLLLGLKRRRHETALKSWTKELGSENPATETPSMMHHSSILGNGSNAADDPVASGGIGRSEFLDDSNLNPLLRKMPLRFAHRLITSFYVARRFDVKAHGYIVHNRMDIDIASAHFAS